MLPIIYQYNKIIIQALIALNKLPKGLLIDLSTPHKAKTKPIIVPTQPPSIKSYFKTFPNSLN